MNRYILVLFAVFVLCVGWQQNTAHAQIDELFLYPVDFQVTATHTGNFGTSGTDGDCGTNGAAGYDYFCYTNFDETIILPSGYGVAGIVVNSNYSDSINDSFNVQLVETNQGNNFLDSTFANGIDNCNGFGSTLSAHVNYYNAVCSDVGYTQISGRRVRSDWHIDDLTQVRFQGRLSVGCDGNTGCGSDPNLGLTYSVPYLILYGIPPLTAEFTVTPDAGSTPLTVSITDNSIGSIAQWEWDWGDGSTPEIVTATPSEPAPHIYTSPGTYTITLTITEVGSGDTATATQQITVDGFIKPFTLDVEDTLPSAANSPPLGNFPSGDIIHMSGSGATNADIQVHAPFDGVVGAIEIIQPAESCTEFQVFTCKFDFAGETYDLIPAYSLGTSAVVTIYSDDNSYTARYTVYDYGDYIDVGTTITAGCVFGLALPLSGPTDVNAVYMQFEENGVGALPANEATSQLSVYPTESTPCDEIEIEPCENTNPNLINLAQGWDSLGTVTQSTDANLNSGGVVLSPGASISQQITTNTTAYNVTIVLGGSGTVTVSLGTESQVIAVDTSESWLQTERLVLTALPAGLTTYPLTIQASENNNSGVTVAYICMGNGETPAILSSGCYFANYNFTSGLNGWSYTNPVGARGGVLLAQNGGTISQFVSLSPNVDGTPHTYRVSVRFFQYEPFGDFPDNATVTYNYGPFSDSADIPNVNILQVGSSSGRVEWDLEVAQSVQEQFTFSFSTSNNDASPVVGNLKVTNVCITPDGDSFPDYPEDAVQVVNVVPPVQEGLCLSVQRPDTSIFDNAINTLLSWVRFGIDLNLNWLECTLLPHFRGLMDLSANQLSLMNGFFEYAAAVMQSSFSWFGEVLGYIGSLFGNIINHPLFSGVLNNVRQTAVDILEVGLDLYERAKDVVITIADIFQLAIENNELLVQAWQNATPKTLPGFQDCTTDIETKNLCLGIWTLDNTVLKDNSLGELMCYLLLAIAAVHAVIWTIGEYRNLVLEMGNTAV